MSKKQIFISLLCATLTAILTFSIYRTLTKPESPFKTYAALIPGTYRLGFTNLDAEVSNVPLTVQGTIPEWLAGTVLRNGPAKFHTATSWVADWFDGLAMIHAFAIEKGAVSYSNKFLVSDAYKHMQKTGNMRYQGFMQDPCASLFKKISSWFFTADNFQKEMAPNANVNIVAYMDRVAALTEIPLPIAFDPHTLTTLGVLNYTDTLPKKDIHDTAHPQYDPHTKKHLGYFTQFGSPNVVNLYTLDDQTLKREVIAQYKTDYASYMHSFAITNDYAILMLIPFVVTLKDLVLGSSFIQSFVWRPELGTKLLVINRHTGTQQGVYHTSPFFAFHTVNAYQQDNQIILDAVIYTDPYSLQLATFDHLLAPTQKTATTHGANGANQDTQPDEAGTLTRLAIDLQTGSVQEKAIVSAFVELPRINYAFNGKQYRYVYTVGQPTTNSRYIVADRLHKINVDTGETLTWQEEHCFPGEPVFVAHPRATKEDDGVVVSVILDTRKGMSFLLILDAQSFTELARAYAPHHIPFGIHGMYMNNSTV